MKARRRHHSTRRVSKPEFKVKLKKKMIKKMQATLEELEDSLKREQSTSSSSYDSPKRRYRESSTSSSSSGNSVQLIKTVRKSRKHRCRHRDRSRSSRNSRHVFCCRRPKIEPVDRYAEAVNRDLLLRPANQHPVHPVQSATTIENIPVSIVPLIRPGDTLEKEATATPRYDLLANGWIATLRTGLSPEARERLIAKYLPRDGNIETESVTVETKLKTPPTVNPEVITVMSQEVKIRDAIERNRQNQLVAGLVALEKLTVGLEKKEIGIKEIVEEIDNISHNLADLHHDMSMTRRSRILKSLGLENVQEDNSFVENHLFNETYGRTLFAESIKQQVVAESIKQQVMAESINQQAVTAKAERDALPRVKGTWILPKTERMRASQQQRKSCESNLETQGDNSTTDGEFPGAYALIEQGYIRRGYLKESIPMMISQERQTIKNYETGLREWFEFCKLNDLDVYELHVPDVIAFFTNAYHNGRPAATLQTYRSAISNLSSRDFGKDPEIMKFFRSLKK